jgi:hypothetical protein
MSNKEYLDSDEEYLLKSNNFKFKKIKIIPVSSMDYFQNVPDSIIFFILDLLKKSHHIYLYLIIIKNLRLVSKRFNILCSRDWEQRVSIETLYIYLYAIEKGLTVSPKNLSLQVNRDLINELDFRPISKLPITTLIVVFRRSFATRINPITDFPIHPFLYKKESSIKIPKKGLVLPETTTTLVLKYLEIDSSSFAPFGSSLTCLRMISCHKNLNLYEMIKKLSPSIESLELEYLDNESISFFTKEMAQALPPNLKILSLVWINLEVEAVMNLPSSLKKVNLYLGNISNEALCYFKKFTNIILNEYCNQEGDEDLPKLEHYV